MNANGEIQIRFPDGTRMTLKDDPMFGFKAFHHCGTFQDGVRVSNKIPMELHIGEGAGNEFHASLTCTCRFTISFMWKPETAAAMTGKLIITRYTGISTSQQEPRPNEELSSRPAPNSVREHIMRSYSI